MTYVLRARSSVKFDRIAPAGFRILAAIDALTSMLGIDLTITCGSDGHPSADPHTTGEAYDVSVAALSIDNVVKAKHALEDVLGPLFTVLYEAPEAPLDSRLRSITFVNAAASGPHLHIQRKRDTVYPPLLGGHA